jgi:SAM-dependent methyltransferase
MSISPLTISPCAHQTAALSNQAFTEAYCQLRQKEGRIVTDDLLRQLPQVSRQHPHYKEWKIRQLSTHRLIQELQQQPRTLDILEVGCGNGWLAAQLSANPTWQVTGIDINTMELEQAQRVFGHLPNLQFLQGSLGDGNIAGKTFDIIVFAASVQYFASLKDIITTALAHSSIRGEVHIIDTPFYAPHELVAARERTVDYYTQMGFAEMANHYFHHSLQELEGFQYKLLHRPGRIWQGLGFVHHPFCHVQIKNHCL